MTDEKLKNIYQAASNEEPSSAIDQLILAEAKAELETDQEETEQKLPWRGWRPLFATAASITLVATLAFQLIPLHEQQWQDATLNAPVKFEVAKQKGSRTVADISPDADAEILEDSLPVPRKPSSPPETLTESVSTEKFQATPMTSQSARQAEVSAIKKAHSKSDSMRQKRLIERKFRRLEAEKELELAAEESKAGDAAVESDVITVTGARVATITHDEIKDLITRINELREQGLTDEAKQMWLSLTKQVTEPPTEEPLKSMWLEVADAFK